VVTEEDAASDGDLRARFEGWLGENPYFLMVILWPDESGGRETAQIDLDQQGWATTFERFMRAPGQWYLARKSDQVIVATMLVLDGEQPYYTARHVAFAGGSQGETISYGIGKKRVDGHVDRVWIMANGCATLGDDVDDISLGLLKSGLL